MSEYNGPERRKSIQEIDDMRHDISKLVLDVAILINKVDANHKSLRETIDRNLETTNKHEKTLYGNGHKGITTKISELEDVRKNFEEHRIQDRWIQGLITTSQIAIIVMLVNLVMRSRP